MEATRIGSVAGGTWPAMIWHDFMFTAHGDNCDDFPLPTEPAEFSPFFGKYATTGAPSVVTPEGDEDSDGTDDPTDPRFYEQAPLDDPNAEPPAEEVAPDPGNGQGPGNGNVPDPGTVAPG
jgi:penicillin-binding protein 1A